MSYLSSTILKINNWIENKNQYFDLNNLNNCQFTLLLSELLTSDKINSSGPLLLLTDTPESATQIYQTFTENLDHLQIELFPSLGLSIYDNFYSSETDLINKWSILEKLIEKKPIFIICDIVSALECCPPVSFFNDNFLELETSQIIPPFDLAKMLSNLGYVNLPSINTMDGNDSESPGCFSKKGEIFDIYPMTKEPIRIFYFDDMIERIAPINPENMRTIQDADLDSIKLMPAPLILAQKSYSLTLRERLPRTLDRKNSKAIFREQIFEQLKEGLLFNNYPIYSPLFFKKNYCLLDYFKQQIIFSTSRDNILSEYHINFDELLSNFKRCKEDIDSDCILPSPEFYFKNFDTFKSNRIISFDSLNIDLNIENDIINNITFNYKDLNFLVDLNSNTNDIHQNLQSLISKVIDKFKYEGQIIFCYNNDFNKDELIFLFEENLKSINSDLSRRITYKKFNLEKSFYDQNNNILFLSENEIYQRPKINRKRKIKKQNLDLFAEQMASLKIGDYVIHSTFGTGKYLGLKQIPFGENLSDYLIIEYKNSDKIYVPIFKMDLVQKQADSTAKLSINNLRNNKFEQLKLRAKNSAKKLAFDLIKLQAKRELQKGFAFSLPDHLFHEFENACPFTLTSDQHLVMTDILDDMCIERPMDRLVCGDVGFGKTELAMRATFKAVLDKKQVAILVPTTILALQHYESFKERFKLFPVNIDFLSRFKSRKDEQKTLEDLKNGKIDIIIGTHKLLSKHIEYKNLGLVIVDEEHRFGVSHKEKLKIFRETIDFLTLTATPIPRTLQLSFLGIRQISLIQTPPPKRQAIKTFLIKADDQTIKRAIDKELKRGGQVYIVHNRVKDIESYAHHIKELCPNAKIGIGHGQMNEKELEIRIKDFYQGKFQILIATTIIESGIDIPNANTMIVNRADHFGLAQLHQLRGRIGRSDRKAFAYFVVSKDKITVDAQKRLKALQTYAEIGTGFQLANCDLEIRGAGDILGGEQSGHVEKIGLELYMQLLQDAISELKGDKKIRNSDFELITPFSTSIPENYIDSSKERLKLYKKFSNCKNDQQIDDLQEYLNDVYGQTPKNIDNLISILKAKILLSTLPLKSVKVAGQQITFHFNQAKIIQNASQLDKLIKFCMARPKTYKLTPDYKMVSILKDEMIPKHFLQHSKDIAELLNL